LEKRKKKNKHLVNQEFSCFASLLTGPLQHFSVVLRMKKNTQDISRSKTPCENRKKHPFDGESHHTKAGSKFFLHNKVRQEPVFAVNMLSL
jgi:hypothetical protein